MTDQKIEEIRARAEKATPGPWKTHLVDDTSVVTEDGTDVCTTCDSSQAEREDGYNVEYERMEADAAFIAHVREDIPYLLAELDRLKAHWDGVCEKRTLADRLRGHYRTAITDGLGPAGGEEPDNPLEHVSTFQVPSIQRAAADRIDQLEAELATLKASGTFSDGIEAAAKAVAAKVPPKPHNTEHGFAASRESGYRAGLEQALIAIRALTPPPAQAQRDDEWATERGLALQFTCFVFDQAGYQVAPDNGLEIFWDSFTAQYKGK